MGRSDAMTAVRPEGCSRVSSRHSTQTDTHGTGVFEDQVVGFGIAQAVVNPVERELGYPAFVNCIRVMEPHSLAVDDASDALAQVSASNSAR